MLKMALKLLCVSVVLILSIESTSAEKGTLKSKNYVNRFFGFVQLFTSDF